MSLLKLKQDYNILIARELKAEAYLENNSIAQATRDKWLPAFNELTIDLSMLMRQYKAYTNTNMSDIEVLTGFKDVM